MATKEIMQPIRISEMMGFSRSADKKIGSEKKNLQPLRVKDLLESHSKSCSRTTERSRKSTFLLPNRSVRRKLYGRSPTPENSRHSYYPSAASRSSISQSQQLTKTSRLSLHPSRTSVCPLKLSDNSQKIKNKPAAAAAATRKSQFTRKSLLPQPNTIVNKIIKKQDTQLKSAKKMSMVAEDPEESEIITPKKLQISQNEEEIEEEEEEVEDRVDEVNIDSTPQMINHHQDNYIRPTVIKCVITEHLRKIENDMDEIKSNQMKLETNQELILSFLKKICNSMDINDNLNDDKNLKITKTPDLVVKEKINNSIIKINNDDKENVNSGKKRKSKSMISSGERRRSLRLAAKNDSFSNLEKQLNIEHHDLENPDKKYNDENIQINSNNHKTPMKINSSKLSSKSDKPMREYMAIKASMNFLETPDVNRFKTRIVDDTPLRQKTLRRSISSKLFDELQDLYLDSPESIK